MHTRIDPPERDSRLASLLQRMRALPAEERPPYDWAEFSERASRTADRPESPVDWRHAVIAAGAACAILVVAIWSRFADDGRVPQTQSAAAETDELSAGAHWDAPDIAAGWLETLPAERAIVRVDTHLSVMELEDSIAWVDELLTMERASAAQPARVMALQRERSRLVDSLARVRYAETLAGQLP
jgi:hypothetical protein